MLNATSSCGSAAHVLEAAFPAVPSAALSRRDLHIVPQGADARWILIGDARAAVPVLRSWSPFNLSARLRWGVLVGAASAGLLPRVPGIVNDHALLDLSYWEASLPGFRDSWTPVVHVGNASHTRKAIVFFVAPDRKIKAVVKVPLVAGASGAILNEATVLSQLQDRDYVPHVLFRDAARGIAGQSWLEGKPISRTLTARHMDLLDSLAETGNTTNVQSHREKLAAELDRCDFPFDRSRLQRALEFLDSDAPLPAFVEHRDFAPWNLKRLADGRLGLLDWEWAVLHSLPCQDIFRFFYIQDALFGGPGDTWQKINHHPLLLAHYQRFSIPPQALPALGIHYLLRVLCMDWLAGSLRLAQHSFRELDVILRSVRAR